MLVASLERCWGGVDQAQYINEKYDVWTQTPGRVSDMQLWLDAYWRNSAGSEVPLWRPLGAPCDVADLASQGCVIASSQHDSWYNWDTRQP